MRQVKVEVFMEDCDLYRSYNQIFITDISVSDSVANMIDILDRVDRRVQLFDHHGTALFLNKYDWCMIKEDIYLPNIFKTCGTELFCVYALWPEYLNIYTPDVRGKIIQFVDIVRNYDTWRWKELDDKGLISKQMNDLFHIYGREKFIDWAMKRIMFGTSPLHQDKWFSETDDVKRSIDTSNRNRKVPKMDLSNMTDQQMREQINRAILEQQYNNMFNPKRESKGREYVSRILDSAGNVLAITSSALGIALAIKELRG